MSEQIFAQLREKLPFETDADSTARRLKIWQSFDVNGNGYLSLAEVDKAMRDVLNLPKLFALKPVLIRAFTAAKNKLPSKNKHGDDYVSKAEFRYLLKYLRQYYEYWVAFDEIDSNDDKRISFAEFSKAMPALKRWGISGDAEKLFKQIDADGQGMILFNEFTAWAIKINLDIDTDDDVV